MIDPTITCPKCGAEIKLTESLAAPLIANIQKDFKNKIDEKDKYISNKEKEIFEKEKILNKAQMTLDQQIEEKLLEKIKEERKKISEEEQNKAKLNAASDLEQKSKEVLALQETLKQSESKLAESQKFQAELLKKQRELDDAKREIELTIEKRIQEEINKTQEQSKKDFENRLTLKLKEQEVTSLRKMEELEQRANESLELKEILKQKEQKLAEAQQAQANLLKRERELEDAKRELALSVEKQVQAELDKIRDQAKKEVEQNLSLKLAEKDTVITALKKNIEDLNKRAEQGSQQLQGEAQEIILEQLLNEKFPVDNIIPVPKGEHGGDVVQKVISQSGSACGSILWEAKRTKNWTDSWLTKLREDQRQAKAEISIIVSHALPKGVDNFEMIDGVWVVHPSIVIPVATLIRNSLIELSMARRTSEGQNTKTELIYQYLTGPRFRLRIEAIVEAFSTMQSDLEKEKKAIIKQWAKRETQIERVMNSTVGMYGDLQGIAGQSLQEIEGLDLAALEAPKNDTQDKNE